MISVTNGKNITGFAPGLVISAIPLALDRNRKLDEWLLAVIAAFLLAIEQENG